VTAAQITAYAVSSVLAAACHATLVQVTDGCDLAICWRAVDNNAAQVLALRGEDES